MATPAGRRGAKWSIEVLDASGTLLASCVGTGTSREWRHVGTTSEPLPHGSRTAPPDGGPGADRSPGDVDVRATAG